MPARATLVLALCALLVLLTAPPATAGSSRCTPRGSKTVKQNAQVRVYTVKNGRATDYYACLRSTGARILVGDASSDDESLSSSTVRTVLVAGTSVAVVSNDFDDIGPEGSESESIIVADLRRRGRFYSRRLDTTEGPYSGFDQVLLRRDGAAAWLLDANGRYTEVDVLGPTAERPTPVAYAREILGRSLEFTGDGVSWTQAGATRTAPIVDTGPTPTTAGAGTVDGTYGRCGVLTPPKPAADASASGAVRLTDGGMLAVGLDEDTLVTVKLRPDGQIDSGYGSGGQTTAKLPAGLAFYDFRAVAAQPDGKIVLAGRGGASSFGRGQAVVARLNPDGSLDTAFGSGGSVLEALPGGMSSESSGLDIDASGRILIAGERDAQFVVARLTSGGAPDPSWGTGGVAQLAFPGTTEGAASAVRALPNGTALAGGRADEGFALARLDGNGNLDPAFGTGGMSTDSPPASARITVIEPLADGRILVAGHGFDVNNQEQAVARFSADGRPDSLFGRGGFALGTDVGEAHQILVQPDGSLLVPGNGFARYSPDGLLDQSFGIGGAFLSFGVGDVVQQPDGSALSIAGPGSRMGFERFALGGPALAALEGQHALCGLRITTSRVKQLVRRRDESRFGGLTVSFDSLKGGVTRWAATAQAGGRTYRFQPLRYQLEGAFRDSTVVALTRRSQARLARARSAKLTLTVRDQAGHELTVVRDLRP